MRRPIQLAAVFAGLFAAALAARSTEPPEGLDARVRRFLEERRGSWHDMNVPEADGQALHDIVLENRYTRGLEIGTSTGRSGIWIGWAMAKTGGTLVTIDIDEGRHRQAVANFAAAGVAPWIEARLADAHDLVPRLEGPFDFVFIDADKDWYTNYAKAVLPKLRAGGSLTAHNVSPRYGRRGMTGDFYEYVTGLPNVEVRFRAGVFVARKTR
ncbi:MAG: putative O-methyltransferase [Acidobacteria bacterium]|nr:putative O-methyltransferase [Acidobacteriota bacterium]